MDGAKKRILLVDDSATALMVERTVLEKELAALKSFWQRLADGLLNDARAGESDQCSRWR